MFLLMWMLPLAGTLNGTEPSWLILSPPQFLLHRLPLFCSCMQQQAQVDVYQKKHLSTLHQAVLLLHRGCLYDLLSSTNCQCVSPQSVIFFICIMWRPNRVTVCTDIPTNTWKKKCWWSTWAPRLPEERASVVQCNTEHSIFSDTLFVYCPAEHFIHHL